MEETTVTLEFDELTTAGLKTFWSMSPAELTVMRQHAEALHGILSNLPQDTAYYNHGIAPTLLLLGLLSYLSRTLLEWKEKDYTLTELSSTKLSVTAK